MVAPLILASASERRKEFLGYLNIPFKTIPADIDETRHDNETGSNYVLRLASEKAAKIHIENPGAVVIGADTTVQVGRHVLEKAESKEEAEEMLRLQSGRKADVLTGLAVIDAEGTLRRTLSANWVQIKELSEDDIQTFLKEEKNWRGCAGCMRTEQNFGASFYPEVYGSITGIIGLPLYETANLLKESGYVL